MADDIFLTPEEQDERARKWLKDNGPALAIGIALGLAAIFGYDQYKNSKIESAEQASALYAVAATTAADSDLSDIDAQVNTLKAEYASSSYAAKAALLKAKQLSVSDLDAAFTELQWVVDNAKEVGLQHAARIRQSKIKIAQEDLATAKILASYTPTQGFDSNYAELLAEISLKQGDESAARKYYQSAIDSLPDDQVGYSRVLSLKLDRLPEVRESTQSEDSATVESSETSEEASKPDA